MRNVVAFGCLLTVVVLAGCGGGSKTPVVPPTVATPMFSPAAGTYATTQSVTLSDTTTGASIYYTTDGTTPTTASTLYSGAISVTGTNTIQALATASQSTSSTVAQAIYTITPPVVTSSASVNFGGDAVNATLTKTVATITNSASNDAPVAVSFTGDASFSLAAGQSCGATVPAGGMCSIVVAYDPTAVGLQTGAVNVALTGGIAAPTAITLSGAAVGGGVVTATINPQVALYTIVPPEGGTVAVQFGTTTKYGFSTSAKATPSGGGSTGVLVAGMLAKTLYHMQATVTFADGTTFTDADQTFTTGDVPAGVVPPLTVTQTTGLTPQPGIELIDTIVGKSKSGAIATDLSGNVIWTYVPPDYQATSILYPIKPLPNGDFIVLINPNSVAPLSAPVPSTALNTLREIDLAGNTVRELTMTQLNAKLAAIPAYAGLTLQVYSHDVTVLPNGHMLILANTLKAFTNVTGYPGTTNVLGDVVVDLDTSMNPVWVWNEFDYFDVNRHPMQFPDWTHSNALVYSADDGDFLVSIRHQNWVVKVNYNDGKGDGSVVWKLGYQGDFALVGGTDPTDWFYAQHNPSYFSTNTAGSFTLGLMDNGDDRVFPDGTNCQTTGGSHCYTTIPVMQVDEKAKTATILSNLMIPTSMYSSFAGDTFLLDNGNTEYNLAGVGSNSYIYEVTSGKSPETVWEMSITTENTYRAYRIPSLYPGVTW